MDFFGAQEEARRRTRLLVVLFLLAVVGVIASVYLAVMIIFNASGETRQPVLWEPSLFLGISTVTSLFIAGGSLYKISALAVGGGESVAESLGGRRIMHGSEELLEQRLLNVVDEMAIASGVPAPRVYILDDEPGINAFAAGFSPQQAVVAVTRGCLEQLSRDELQGVIAHEFSHILNGDMRLNLRLIGVLHGILLLALLGRVILENAHGGSRKNGGAIVILGLALLVIGYIGVFFGNLIKAAASRQREFLADASAVQFTRNPGGIAGALKKIGGFEASVVRHPRAQEASHLFFGEGLSGFFNWFATHPPIEERISRIDRTFRAEQGQQERTATGADSGVTAAFAPSASMTVSPQQVVASIGTLQPERVAYAQQLLDALPATIRAAIDQPQQARTLVYALLVVDEPHPLIALQQGLVNETTDIIELSASHVAALKLAGRAAWLPILEIVIPELDAQEGQDIDQLLDNTKRLINADGRLTLFEYLIDSLLNAALVGKPGDRGVIYRYPHKAVQADCSTVLSLLAHFGHREASSAHGAFTAAIVLISGNESIEPNDRSALSLSRFEQALTRLATIDFRMRARLIEACTTAITHDNRITITEAELLRIIGAKLDCPIPPLLPNR